MNHSHVELKVDVAVPDVRVEVDFDDVRLYPGPSRHPVTIVVDSPLDRTRTRPEYPIENLKVRLVEEDSKQVLGEGVTDEGGQAQVTLRSDVIFPVAARIEVWDDLQMLATATIPREGVRGLYPSDVWVVRLPSDRTTGDIAMVVLEHGRRFEVHLMRRLYSAFTKHTCIPRRIRRRLMHATVPRPLEIPAQAVLADRRWSGRAARLARPCAGRRTPQEYEPTGDLRRSRRTGLEAASHDHGWSQERGPGRHHGPGDPGCCRLRRAERRRYRAGPSGQVPDARLGLSPVESPHPGERDGLGALQGAVGHLQTHRGRRSLASGGHPGRSQRVSSG